LGAGVIRQAGWKIHVFLERHLPEQRLFLRSGDETRFLRLSPLMQAGLLGGGAALILWTAVATAILTMDAVGGSDIRQQALRDRAMYQERLNAMAAERDARAAEASRAQTRFYAALEEVSTQQSLLLDLEARERELADGLAALRRTLAATMDERDAARSALVEVAAAPGGPNRAADALGPLVVAALRDTTGDRDGIAAQAAALEAELAALKTELRRQTEQIDRVLARLEEAIAVSMEPLDAVFRRVGLDPERVLDDVRAGYSGQGGPFNPIAMSSKSPRIDPLTSRADGLLEQLDRINLYRIAVQRAPLAMPLQSAFRYTSGFGNRRHPITGRWDMHEGVDMAGRHGSPIYATGDGTVSFAGWQSGYGRLVRIRHANGFETRYGHLSRIRVSVGDRVSQGDRIGDMGNTGRSTGTHLHYEVRIDGRPLNPMEFIRAGQDVL
jgi:murein DD-endopeptidase MepM/ murein hydrolase activator NlpD